METLITNFIEKNIAIYNNVRIFVSEKNSILLNAQLELAKLIKDYFNEYDIEIDGCEVIQYPIELDFEEEFKEFYNKLINIYNTSYQQTNKQITRYGNNNFIFKHLFDNVGSIKDAAQ